MPTESGAGNREAFAAFIGGELPIRFDWPRSMRGGRRHVPVGRPDERSLDALVGCGPRSLKVSTGPGDAG